MSRVDDLSRFYDILGQVAEQQDGGYRLGDCHGRQGWPDRGVYFFFEPDEQRSDSGSGPRVVRVGTHALARGSRATLWKRLAQHRGTRAGSGNHRGSIFRLLVGEAILARDDLRVPSWGLMGSLGAAARRLNRSREALARGEAPIERHVSSELGDIRLVVVGIDDEPGPASLRGYVERNAIALLSNFERPPLDPPSTNWLGRESPREKIRHSGLWNQDHVQAWPDERFLEILARLAQSCACSYHADCDDGNPCTATRCEEGACMGEPVEAGADCALGDDAHGARFARH